MGLMGKRPQDVLDDFEVSMMMVACHGAHPEPWTMWNECHQARLGAEGKPMYIGRTKYLEEFKYGSKEEAVADLKEIVARETKKRNARKAEPEPIHARDRAEAGERAKFHTSPPRALLERYQASHARRMQRSVHPMMKHRHHCRRGGAG